jgi:uncharacterized membrane protein
MTSFENGITTRASYFEVDSNRASASRASFAYGINTSGQIVGNFNNAAGANGFIDTAGVFTTIDFPGSIGTIAREINDSARITVANYSDAGTLIIQYNYRSAPVPEPATLLLILTGVGSVITRRLVYQLRSGEPLIC